MARRFASVLIAAALVLASASLGGQETARLSVPYTQFTLANGLDLIMHVDRSIPVAAVNVWYHVGSQNEEPDRTSFAHLFEHLMFEGSGHVPEGDFDNWLEAAGGDNNGSTDTDRTNYWETVPSNALELALFLESDRMGYLLGAMSPEKVNGQRDVVKNERRQSYENRPYGVAFLKLSELMFPPSHPYLQELLRSEQHDARRRRRHRSGRGAALRREVVLRRAPRRPGPASLGADAGARRGETGHARGSGPAPAALPGLADAVVLPSRR
jgi:hypothetical protein